MEESEGRTRSGRQRARVTAKDTSGKLAHKRLSVLELSEELGEQSGVR